MYNFHGATTTIKGHLQVRLSRFTIRRGFKMPIHAPKLGVLGVDP